jgi:hypothetical protein
LKAAQLDPKSSIVLAFLIADRGNQFPNPEQMFSFRGAFSQAAMLISDLMLNISDQEERFRLAKELTTRTEPITFAAEVVRWLREYDENARPNSYTKEEKSSLRSLLASRIKELSSTIDLFSEYPEDVGYLLSIWSIYGIKSEVSQYLINLFKKNPSEIDALLLSFVPAAYLMDTGIGKKGDFERDAYNRISDLIAPTEIVSILEKLYGKQIYVQEYPNHYQGDISGLAIAQQFSWIHQQVLQEEDKKSKDQSVKENK